jgi:hypothetical protein
MSDKTKEGDETIRQLQVSSVIRLTLVLSRLGVVLLIVLPTLATWPVIFDARSGDSTEGFMVMTVFIWLGLYCLEAFALRGYQRTFWAYSAELTDSVNIEQQRLNRALAKAFGELVNAEIEQVAPEMSSAERMQMRQAVARINVAVPDAAVEDP